MKTPPCLPTGEPHSRPSGFTLIEVIGVLTVVAILAAMIVPNLLRQLDQAVTTQETANLQACANALQASILRNYSIPSATNWASVVATEIGWDTYDVATNGRGRPRILLIDPAFQIGTNNKGLPYTQSIAGSTLTNSSGVIIAPASPRMMLLSSISTTLPTNVVSGVPAVSNDFSAIWNTPVGGLPATTSFAGWKGTNDLQIQRINLSGLFVKLVLTTYGSSANGLFAINPANFTGTNTVLGTNGYTAYYLQNSTLRLINTPSNTVDSDQILIRDTSYVYNQNAWWGSLSTSNVAVMAVGGIADFASIVNSFLVAPTNSSEPTGIRQAIVTDMMNYHNAYNAYSTNLNSTANYNNAVSAESTLMNDINTLINAVGNF